MAHRSLLAALLALLTMPALLAPAGASAASASGHRDDPAVVISGDVRVDRGESVDGVFVISGDVRIDGEVDGDVVAISGDVVVSGTVDGNLYTLAGRAELLSGALVTGDVDYADERPIVDDDARVQGEIHQEGLPELGGFLPLLGAFVLWLAITASTVVLGCLLLLLFPRAADAVRERAGERAGPTIAIGIAILIALPVLAVLAAFTVLGLPLAVLVGLALLPLGGIAYVAAAWALGRTILKPPRNRFLAFLAGLAILRALALVPVLGLLVGLAALIFGLGLLGAAIGASRRAPPAAAEPAGIPGS